MGGLKYLLLGLLLVRRHNLCSYWSVSQVEKVSSLPRQGGQKAGICQSGPKLCGPAGAKGSRPPRGGRPQDRVCKHIQLCVSFLDLVSYQDLRNSNIYIPSKITLHRN